MSKLALGDGSKSWSTGFAYGNPNFDLWHHSDPNALPGAALSTARNNLPTHPLYTAELSEMRGGEWRIWEHWWRDADTQVGYGVGILFLSEN